MIGTEDSAGDVAGERDDAHLADVEDGCGCAEVWEHLSERRVDEWNESTDGASGEAASSEATD